MDAFEPGSLPHDILRVFDLLEQINARCKSREEHVKADRKRHIAHGKKLKAD